MSLTLKEKEMETEKKEDIRQAVRESYGKVARAGGVTIGTSPAASCCSPPDTNTESSQTESCGCVPPGVSAKQMSTIMGYSKEDLASLLLKHMAHN